MLHRQRRNVALAIALGSILLFGSGAIIVTLAGTYGMDWVEKERGTFVDPAWSVSEAIRKAGVQPCSAYFDCCNYISSTNATYKAQECHELYYTLQRALESGTQSNYGRGGTSYRIESSWGGLLWQGAAGKTRVDDASLAAPQSMTLNTPFEIASVTKTITASLILLLAEYKKVSLMDPITKYLPENITKGVLMVNGVDHSEKLKVWHLLSHRGGLPDFWTNINFLQAFQADYRRFWYPTESIAYAKQLRGFFIPQSSMSGRFYYTDTGFVLAGMIIEAVMRKPLHTMFREWLFDPLGMKSCYLSFREKPRLSETESHRYEGSRDLYGRMRQSADWASGGVVCNNEDLSKFIRYFFENNINKEKTMRLVKAVGPTHGFFQGGNFVAYSLGVMRIRLKGLGSLWGHDGYGNVFGFYWEEMEMSVTGTFNQLKNDWLSRSLPMLKYVKTFLYKVPPKSDDPVEVEHSGVHPFGANSTDAETEEDIKKKRDSTATSESEGEAGGAAIDGKPARTVLNPQLNDEGVDVSLDGGSITFDEEVGNAKPVANAGEELQVDDVLAEMGE